MVTLRRIEIHRFRNVEPGTVIELHSGINVLLGRNGSGKTTLLQWLADILSGQMQEWAGEPYDVVLEIHDEQARAVFRWKNAPSKVRALQQFIGWSGRDADEWLADHDEGDEYAIDIDVDVNGRHYAVQMRPSELILLWPDGATIKSEQKRPQPRNISDAYYYGLIAAPHALGLRDSGSLYERNMDLLSYGQTRRFDEALGLFSSITGHGVSGENTTRIRLIAMRSEEAVASNGMLPKDLATLLEGRVAASREAKESITSLSFSHIDVSFLHKAVELFDYSFAVGEIMLLKKDIWKEMEAYEFGDVRFTFGRPDGSIINHTQLSFGQKRMLAFLYYVAANPSIVIVDELVNGLHHAWIDACLEEIGDRQALLTSQNPLLLDYLSFESPDEVRTRFVLCRSERRDGKERLIWRNPTMEEAESFFSAYEAGIQHVGEILMDKGLW